MMATSEHMTSTEVGHDGGEQPFPPFDFATITPSLLIWLALTFGALYILMWKVALPRVEGIFKARSGKIDSDLGMAFKKREEADRAAANYQKTLADARANAQGIAQQTYAQLAAESDAKRHALEAELAGTIAAAEAQIEATKAKAMGNVDQIAREAAATIVEHITGKPADPAAIEAAFKA
jgi:F-type H+-transporting ATPase subunit b